MSQFTYFVIIDLYRSFVVGITAATLFTVDHFLQSFFELNEVYGLFLLLC